MCKNPEDILLSGGPHFTQNSEIFPEILANFGQFSENLANFSEILGNFRKFWTILAKIGQTSGKDPQCACRFYVTACMKYIV